MIFHIPTTSELVSTDVAYQVPLYDETATYQDGAEVRIDDKIYTVTNYTENIQYPEYVEYTPAEIGDKVVINGNGYEKYDIVTAIGCWEKLGADTIDESKLGTPVTYENLDDVTFNVWDGETYGSWIGATVQGGTCAATYFKFITSAVYDDHSVAQVWKSDTADDNAKTFIGTIDYYYNETPRKSPYWIKKSDGKMHEVFGYSSEYIEGTGVDLGIWHKLEQPYYEVNRHRLDYIRPSIKQLPFDTKQYTSADVDGSQKWTIRMSGAYNSVVLGSVSGYSVTVDFATTANPIASEIVDSVTIPLNTNRLASTETRADGTKIYLDYPEPTTQIVYSNSNAEYAIISITAIAQDYSIDGYVEKSSIGMIFPAVQIDVGATNLEFTHDIKNFDKNKVSEVSGYIDHIKGQRVVQHKGSFDIPLTDYDKMLMINKRFTQELIAIDGSDTTSNEASDSKSRFQSTKLIGRVKRLGMQTRTKQNKLDDTQTITFEFEEIV